MFGYVQIRKPELKIKDYDTYHGFYCGLCERLREKYGFKGQITLTYDMTFMTILLSSLYDVKNESRKTRCIVHPARKHLVIYNEITDYCADMNVMLSYYHFLDDKQDEHSVKGNVGTAVYRKVSNRMCTKYKEQSQAIQKALGDLSALEKSKSDDILKLADCFGRLLSEILSYRCDAFEKYLRNFGYFLGRFIYIMDAYDDLEDDLKDGQFNPFLNVYNEDDFEEKVNELLLNEISMACGEYEKLPCIQYQDILRNILYAGVWNRYDAMRDKKREDTQ